MVIIKMRPRMVTGKKRTTTMTPRKVAMEPMLPNPVSAIVDFLESLFDRNNLWISWGLYAALLTWLSWVALPISILLSLWLAGGAYCSWFSSWLFFKLRDVA
jgi:hypothetical protein